MSGDSHHIVPYRVYVIVLAFLLLMTSISVAVTQIELATLTIFIALMLASIKSAVVLYHFMHLKFDSLFIRIMVAAIFLLIGIVFFITFLDYNYR
jgi:cytochrome c oxidase subunit 4